MNEQRKDVQETLLSKLQDIIWNINELDCNNPIMGYDLHHELFNTDYFIIGTYKAKCFCGSATFDIIEMIREYEQDNIGKVVTDFSNPEKVANMFAYIVAEEFLQQSRTLNHRYDNGLDYEDFCRIKDEIEAIKIA